MLKRAASAMLVCAASIAMPYFGQNEAYFNTQVTPTSAPGASSAYSVDVNNDGIPDIITENGALPSGFTVFLSNGDGSFRSSYSFTFPSQYQSGTPIAYADLNGDGKVDLLVEMAGFAQLAYFAGNGDGTFQAPVYENISMPSGQHFGGEEMLVADFTGDGKVDVVTEGNGSGPVNDLVLIPGEGNGQFGAAKVVYTAPTDHGPGWSLRLGDFDADGHADFAFSESTSCNQGGCSAGTLHVEYGDGTGNFTDTTPYSSSGYVFQFNTGDLNNDGMTDIVGFSEGAGVPQLIALYGQTGRTFALHTMSSGLSSSQSALGVPVIGDFNGDGANDIAALGWDSTQNVLVAYLGNNTPGTFTKDQFNLSVAGDQDLVAGDFKHDMKPDIAWTYRTSSGSREIVTETNGTPTGAFTNGCAYPANGQGINACTTAGSASSPTVFHATTSSFGKIRKLELWVDGKKIGEQWHDWGDHYAFFNLSTTLAAGNHTAAYYAADVDNRLQKSTFGFTVGSTSSGCAAPSSAGVHVCSPANNSTVASPVKVTATAKVTGTLARMEVWVDGVKKYTETSSTSLNTSIALGSGTHRFGIYAVNTAGTKWETTVYATVN